MKINDLSLFDPKSETRLADPKTYLFSFYRDICAKITEQKNDKFVDLLRKMIMVVIVLIRFILLLSLNLQWRTCLFDE